MICDQLYMTLGLASLSKIGVHSTKCAKNKGNDWELFSAVMNVMLHRSLFFSSVHYRSTLSVKCLWIS